uniref:Uncharacterized protein n=1 Tax=Oryza sativa subsp. japonica TaxID=39947 RepID=Q69SR6_ORYSJ|nr:hypothetical protein [Oryza sativa Japonica Group]BAD35969.1 hypothetical protein [Oryza sativa Japonica Group]
MDEGEAHLRRQGITAELQPGRHLISRTSPMYYGHAGAGGRTFRKSGTRTWPD